MVGKSTMPRRPRAGDPGSFSQLYLLTVKKCYMARFGHCEPAHAGDTLSRLGDGPWQQMDLAIVGGDRGERHEMSAPAASLFAVSIAFPLAARRRRRG